MKWACGGPSPRWLPLARSLMCPLLAKGDAPVSGSSPGTKVVASESCSARSGFGATEDQPWLAVSRQSDESARRRDFIAVCG
jgi:hypothetical protein